jgi:hypothetical protein
MDHNTILKMFEAYIPSKQWPEIYKVSVKYKENSWLRWMILFQMKGYRNYFLKVTYKDNSVKFIPLAKDAKDEIKSHVMTFNFHINSLK